jgi:hypothetical protein
MDNVSADVAFSSASQPNAGILDDFFAPLPFLAMADYNFKVSGLWGFADFKVGGINADYYAANDYRLPAIDWFSSSDDDISSSNTASPAFLWAGSLTALPIQTTYNIGSLVESVPLTIRTGVNVPTTAMTYRDFFAANMWIASAEYAMDGIGDFVVGGIPAFAYTNTTGTTGNYTKDTTDVMSQYFLDANISAVENLQLQAAVDLGIGSMDSNDPAASTGTGTAADPFVTSEISYTGLNFGVEFIYDLGNVMEGLEVDGALAISSLSGLNSLNTTGVAWVAPTDGANNFVGANYNEASAFGTFALMGMSPFTLGVGVTYAIDDNNEVSLSDEYNSIAGDLTTDMPAAYQGAATTLGYYGTNDISVGYSVASGNGKLSTSLGYTMYIGLPTAGDYGVTGASNIATYDAALANAFQPLSFNIKYTASF